MGTEKFCLKWNDFESNISGAFKDIRDEKDFFDVTLACDDDQLQAHKVILSACSPFFRTILKRNPHQHPLLYLKGVKYSDLQSVLNFMYHGEVNVAQDELNSFLAVAEELRVKGLTQNNGSQSSGGGGGKSRDSHQPKSPSTPAAKALSRPADRDGSAAPPPKRPRPTPLPPAPAKVDDDDIQEVVPVKSEPRDSSSAVIANPASSTAADIYQGGGGGGGGGGGAGSQQHSLALQQEEEDYGGDESYDDYGQYDQSYDGQMMDPNLAAGADGNKGEARASLSQYIERIVSETGKPSFKCKMCGKVTGQKAHAENHVESIHFPGTFVYTCKFCLLNFTGRNKLYLHVSQNHHKKRIQDD